MTKYDEYESPLAHRYASMFSHEQLEHTHLDFPKDGKEEKISLTQWSRQGDKEDIFAARKGFDVAKALALAFRGGEGVGPHSDHRQSHRGNPLEPCCER